MLRVDFATCKCVVCTYIIMDILPYGIFCVYDSFKMSYISVDLDTQCKNLLLILFSLFEVSQSTMLCLWVNFMISKILE